MSAQDRTVQNTSGREIKTNRDSNVAAAHGGASGGFRRRCWRRYDRKGSRVLNMWREWKKMSKSCQKTEKKGLLDMKQGDEGRNFGRRLAERGGSDFNTVWCVEILAERRLQWYRW
ncbi:hypothetical protein PIB30_026799 [Stylosanthes scabra]|uniref:Uncharacterized protein n=1 Tax=Stylosanthes scabra TaxID=79078 RepID=A0ABU6Z7G5_9FABA|nr:hypothetical protein [Stylosanthes scabra]